MTKLEFINQISTASRNLFPQFKIPVSVAIAQACLESSFGRFDMGVYNLFGHKGTGPAGSVIKKTKEFDKNTQSFITIDAKFRAYNNYEQSVSDYMRNLSTNKAYKSCRKHLNDPNLFAKSLTGIYATDPHYGDKLIRLMEQFNLYQYDLPYV